MSLTRSLFAIAFGVSVACSGGGGTGPGGGAGNGGGAGGGGGGGDTCPAGAVCMLAVSFTPLSLTVARNATVPFVNNSGITHDVRFDGTRSPGVDDIGLHSSGTRERLFNTMGRFPFHCSQHSGMNGEIVVN